MDGFVGGSLRLKGTSKKYCLLFTDYRSSKGKRAKKLAEKSSESVLDAPTVNIEPNTATSAIFVTTTKTSAQLKFENVQLARKHDKIERMAEKSHKERVQEFNSYLEHLTEHNDIPKVGPG